MNGIINYLRTTSLAKTVSTTKTISLNKYRGYFLALTLVPTLLSLLMLIAMVKGNNVKVSNALYLITGLCNLTGFVCLRRCDQEQINKLRFRKTTNTLETE